MDLTDPRVLHAGCYETAKIHPGLKRFGSYRCPCSDLGDVDMGRQNEKTGIF